jgi:hypothetical protein
VYWVVCSSTAVGNSDFGTKSYQYFLRNTSGKFCFVELPVPAAFCSIWYLKSDLSANYLNLKIVQARLVHADLKPANILWSSQVSSINSSLEDPEKEFATGLCCIRIQVWKIHWYLKCESRVFSRLPCPLFCSNFISVFQICFVSHFFRNRNLKWFFFFFFFYCKAS